MSADNTAEPPEQNTRSRILQVAMDEFSEHGSSGARVEKIAKAAGVNIRMIYYFFGSKKGLLDEVLRQIFLERRAKAAVKHDTVEDLMLAYFDGYAADPDRVRLLQWEALEAVLPKGANLLTNLEDRKAVIAQRISLIVDLQKRGKIPADLDPKMLYLMFVSLAIYPMSFPQSVFVATGEHASSKAFLKRYRSFLSDIGKRLFASA
jgi:TetR/AcrR family transcriptional regulator